MLITITPTYTDLFNEPCPDPQSFLLGYNSKDILFYLSMINSELYLKGEDGTELQTDLLIKCLKYWPEDLKKEMLLIVSNFLNTQKSKPNFFKSLYITYFIHHELINFKENGILEFNAYAEYQFLKAYFAYVSKYSDEAIDIIPESISEENDKLKFQKQLWPFILNQFDFNERVDPLYQSICTGSLLDHFYLDPKYKAYAVNYLKHYKRNSVWQFVFDLLALVQISFQKIGDHDVHAFVIRDSEGFTDILDNLSINVDKYFTDKKLHEDFLGIRQKPLFKNDNGFYIVMSWKFFYKSVYLGILFDFHKKSGINKELDFPSYKSIVGFEVMEKKMFEKIFSYAMSSKHNILHFSKDNEDNTPDCYLRIGKYLFLIEFKDYLINTNVISSGNFDKFKKHLETKFVQNENGKSKGVSQIYSQLEIINKGGFSFDNFEKRGIKKRNLIVYPIIVTTSYQHQLPGVNSYLSEVLIERTSSNSEFTINIEPLTMIDFTFFYRNFNRIRKKEIALLKLVQHYQSSIKNCQRQFCKTAHLAHGHKAHAAFESALSKNITPKNPAQLEKGFTKALFEALQIVPELTTINSLNKKSSPI